MATIAVIDNSPLRQEIARATLEVAGHRVFCSHDCALAAKQISAAGVKDVDLVIIEPYQVGALNPEGDFIKASIAEGDASRIVIWADRAKSEGAFRLGDTKNEILTIFKGEDTPEQVRAIVEAALLKVAGHHFHI